MARRRGEDAAQDQQKAELEALRPFLGLAREIKANVDRAVADDAVDAVALVEAIDAVPTRERHRLVLSVFEHLSPEQQWTVLARAFGDDLLREHLAAEHDARLEWLRRHGEEHRSARAARLAGHLRVDLVPEGTVLTLGLFVPAEARPAVQRGRGASTCARELTVRATGEPGVVHVVEDLYNPRRGLFVTSDYDERAWEDERLDSHARVRLGALIDAPTPVLEPSLYPAGRVDVGHEGRLTRGRLHLGYAVIGDEDVFAAPT